MCKHVGDKDPRPLRDDADPGWLCLSAFGGRSYDEAMRGDWLAMAAIAVACATIMFACATSAPAREVDPKTFGIELPAGTLAAGDHQAVTTTDAAGQGVVGRIHARVGDAAVVLLPDGQLVARKAGEFMPTDRRFEPLTKEALQARLAAEFPGFKVGATEHYVYVYDSSEEFAFGTSRILESMLPGLKAHCETVQRLSVHNPVVPLVAVMFQSEESFQKYRRMPEGVVAYYHTLSNRVFMYEQSRLARVRPDLALQQAISTVAHEGAHQILHNIGVQQRLSAWPMWLSEGLAEYFAPTAVTDKLKWKGAGQVNDLRMFELEQYLKSKAAEEPSGEMVEYTMLAGRLTSTGYATAWALTHYLAKNRRTEFASLLREVSKLGPFEGATDIVPPGIIRENREQFRNHFGDDFKALESRLVTILKKLPYTDPFQNSPHFVATLLAGEGRKQQRIAMTFHSPQYARNWLNDSLAKFPEPQRAAAQTSVRQFPNRQQAEVYVGQWLSGR